MAKKKVTKISSPVVTKVLAARPPIVVVLGHVDHGKTTLLDTIRKTNIAAREHGGITQKIGAYQIEYKTGNKETRRITFIDTPGHEAFAKMRERGAEIADLAILVVAADDSVKPQTKESIEQVKAAKIPMIVAINKIDLPGSLPDKVKSDLAKVGVQVEGFGGDIPFALVSAKSGTGMPELLELILLVADMKGIPEKRADPLFAPVIETRIDKGKGMVASVVIREGMIKNGTLLYDFDNQIAKVRAMFDENGKIVSEAEPGKPVEILGFTAMPQVGAVLRDAPLVRTPTLLTEAKSAGLNLPDFLKPAAEQEQKKLIIVLKADTAGSLEAILGSLSSQIKVVGQGVGDISDADVLQAKATGAIIIGFNVTIKPQVVKLAQTEKVIYRTYNIIYELLDELSEVVAGLKEVLHEERELGMGVIIAEFPFEKMRVAGTKVKSGRLARGDTVKIMRAGIEVGRAKIKTLKQGKNDVTKAEVGTECGVLLDRIVDFSLQDAIIAVTI